MNKGTLIFQIPKDSDFEFSTRTNLFKILKVFDLESFVMRRHCHDFVLLKNLKGITYFRVRIWTFKMNFF